MPEHKQGWAVVDFYNREVKTCDDVGTRDSILRSMVGSGVPLTDIHVFEFSSHRRPSTANIELAAPMTYWT